MSVDAGLVEWVTEALAPLGHVTMRAMMGGATLYLDGIAFAITGDDGLWLKAVAVTDAAWDAAGCAKFSYTFSNGRVGTMNYRRAPDGVYDDPDELRQWAEPALAAGLRAAAAKSPRKLGPKAKPKLKPQAGEAITSQRLTHRLSRPPTADNGPAFWKQARRFSSAGRAHHS